MCTPADQIHLWYSIKCEAEHREQISTTMHHEICIKGMHHTGNHVGSYTNCWLWGRKQYMHGQTPDLIAFNQDLYPQTCQLWGVTVANSNSLCLPRVSFCFCKKLISLSYRNKPADRCSLVFNVDMNAVLFGSLNDLFEQISLYNFEDRFVFFSSQHRVKTKLPTHI